MEKNKEFGGGWGRKKKWARSRSVSDERAITEGGIMGVDVYKASSASISSSLQLLQDPRSSSDLPKSALVSKKSKPDVVLILFDLI